MGGKNSDDGCGFSVKRKRLANDLWIGGKPRSPQSVGQKSGAGCIGAILVMREIAAQKGRHAKCGQKGGIHLTAAQPYGIFFGEVAVYRAGLDRGKRLECGLTRS